MDDDKNLNQKKKKLLKDSKETLHNVFSESKKEKSYNTGIMFESVFVSMFKKYDVVTLDKFQNLINTLKREKIEKQRIIDAQNTKNQIEKNQLKNTDVLIK